ncbi:hypothetical protein B4966_00390 [Rhodocyclaceae bacterium]|nr:hypothetical protein B4966_00390 [Rhodocyclaceae bacterium]
MNRIVAALSIAILSTSAFAGPSCNAPKEKWMDQDKFKAGLETQGYRIKTFKVSKGNCYEIYGFDKAGNKVEIYFDPQTGAELERK